MNAGELRHRITIRQGLESKTTRGGFTVEATTIYSRIPALVEPLAGHELNVAMQIDPRLKWTITLRFAKGIQARQIVIYHALEGDRTLEIVQPPQLDEKDRKLTLLCGEATT